LALRHGPTDRLADRDRVHQPDLDARLRNSRTRARVRNPQDDWIHAAPDLRQRGRRLVRPYRYCCAGRGTARVPLDGVVGGPLRGARWVVGGRGGGPDRRPVSHRGCATLRMNRAVLDSAERSRGGSPMAEFTDLALEIDDPVAIITLNRPEKLNAFTYHTLAEIRQAVDTAATDPAVVGIIITGKGRGFSAGLDSLSLAESTADG